MLEVIEVNEALRHEENGYRYMGALHVLYRQEPTDVAPFIELRQWSTIADGVCELVAEWGYLDAAGDLQTQCTVLPFHWNTAQALAWIGEQLTVAA